MATDTMLLTACPHCRRRYRVRADQVPAQGVRARCPHCGAVFPVVPAVAPNSTSPASTEAAPAGSHVWTNELEKARPDRGVIGEVRPRPPGINGYDPDLAPELHAAGAATDEQARSLARALASDLVAYHPREVEQGRGSEKLVSLLGSEIAASWDMYVSEVGEELARTTPYFRDALNEALARGEQYF